MPTNGLFDPLRVQQSDPLGLNTVNALALGPLYAPRDPGTILGAGAGPTASRGVDPRLFVPALRLTSAGRKTVYSGEMGQLHEDVINKVAGADEDAYFAGNPELGFVNLANGRFHTRDQAAKAIGITEASELPTYDPKAGIAGAVTP